MRGLHLVCVRVFYLASFYLASFYLASIWGSTSPGYRRDG